MDWCKGIQCIRSRGFSGFVEELFFQEEFIGFLQEGLSGDIGQF